MSDFDRNAVAGRYGQTVGREDTALVDQGLRAYMLRVYNYMVLGLAITGFAALGIYMLSVTGDLSSAAYVLRGGRLYAAASVTAVQARDVLLTSLGHTLFFTPLKWAVILAPLGLVFFLSFRIQNMRPATA